MSSLSEVGLLARHVQQRRREHSLVPHFAFAKGNGIVVVGDSDRKLSLIDAGARVKGGEVDGSLLVGAEPAIKRRQLPLLLILLQVQAHQFLVGDSILSTGTIH